METATALQVAHEAAKLVQYVASYQAKFGRSYEVKPGSSREAWDLYHQIFNQQAAIARLLDVDVLEQASSRLNRWWERQETLDLSIAEGILRASGHLIACIAYFVEDGHGAYTVHSAQHMLACMLHPAARQVALGTVETSGSCIAV